MGMEDILPFACLILEKVAMTCAVLADYATHDYRLAMLIPRTERRLGGGVAHGIVEVAEIVARIEKIVGLANLHDRWALAHRPSGVGGIFPTAFSMETLASGVLLQRLEVAVHLRHEDTVALLQTHMIHIRFLALEIYERVYFLPFGRYARRRWLRERTER